MTVDGKGPGGISDFILIVNNKFQETSHFHATAVQRDGTAAPYKMGLPGCALTADRPLFGGHG